MTFRESYESGYRFKLPTDYGGTSGWPEYWWLLKKPDDSKIYFTAEEGRSVTIWEMFRVFISNSFDDKREQKRYWLAYIKSNDWYLHPDDEKIYLFNKKVEKIINE